MAATHVHTGRWLDVKPRNDVERAPRLRRRQRAWTRLFFAGEPRPWHTGAAIFGIVTVGLYLLGIIVLPFVVM